jgi:hypothetical protein
MRKILLIAVAALAFAPEAGAKVCASVRVVPAHPVVGQSVHVRLTTWMPRWVGSRAYFARHEGLPTSRPLRVQVAPPHAAPFTIAPRRDPARNWSWQATFKFARAGNWKLRPDDRRWAFAPRTCAPTLSVRVVRRAG